MPRPGESKKSKADLAKQIDKFLKDNPGASEALEQFGISNERYKMLVESQSRPVFYTANSTNLSESNGELD